jgi:hypothetical protein
MLCWPRYYLTIATLPFSIVPVNVNSPMMSLPDPRMLPAAEVVKRTGRTRFKLPDDLQFFTKTVVFDGRQRQQRLMSIQASAESFTW